MNQPTTRRRRATWTPLLIALAATLPWLAFVAFIDLATGSGR